MQFSLNFFMFVTLNALDLCISRNFEFNYVCNFESMNASNLEFRTCLNLNHVCLKFGTLNYIYFKFELTTMLNFFSF